METYSIIKKNYGVEMNNTNSVKFNTKEEAKKAGEAWIKEGNPFLSSEEMKGWNFEVIENN